MSDTTDNRFYREKQGQLASKEIVAALRAELSRSDGANVIVRSGHLRQALDEIERRSPLAGDEQAEAWESVWEKLWSFNPKFYEQGRNGEEAALQEIDRLQRTAHEPPAAPKQNKAVVNEILHQLDSRAAWLPNGERGDRLCEEAAALIRRLQSSQPPGREWQPIDTAPPPSDGEALLVAVSPFADEIRESVVGEARRYDGVWYWAGNDPTDSWGGPITPTHWMPMPKGPTATKISAR
jgi:hypothetical protein